jgi:hypothetical protein
MLFLYNLNFLKGDVKMKRLIKIAVFAVVAFSSTIFATVQQYYGYVNDIYMPVNNGAINVQLTGANTWYGLSYNTTTTPMILATLLSAKTSGARVEIDADPANSYLISAVHILNN